MMYFNCLEISTADVSTEKTFEKDTLSPQFQRVSKSYTIARVYLLGGYD